jgi:thiamine pyrophosphokinase
MPAEGIVHKPAQGAREMVVVVTGGDPVDPAHLPPLPPGTRVVAADSGVEQAQALGLEIDVAIGDFDSVAPHALDAARDAGAAIDEHPAVKDATDLELALDRAIGLRDPAATHVHVLGGHGGRLDHLLANVLLLARDAYAGVTLTAQMGLGRVTVIRTSSVLAGPVGDLVTLLPVGGPARAVTTTGLLYPLTGEDLEPGSTRGVSNELVDDTARIDIAGGVLLAIQPGQLGTHHQQENRT